MEKSQPMFDYHLAQWATDVLSFLNSKEIHLVNKKKPTKQTSSNCMKDFSFPTAMITISKARQIYK